MKPMKLNRASCWSGDILELQLHEEATEIIFASTLLTTLFLGTLFDLFRPPTGKRNNRPSPSERFLKDDEDEAERGIGNGGGGGGDSLFPLSIVVAVDPMNVVSSILTAALRSGGGLFFAAAAATAASSCSSLISRRRGSEIVWAMKLAAGDLLVREKERHSAYAFI